MNAFRLTTPIVAATPSKKRLPCTYDPDAVTRTHGLRGQRSTGGSVKSNGSDADAPLSLYTVHASSHQPSGWLAGLIPRAHQLWKVSCLSEPVPEVVPPSYSMPPTLMNATNR